MLAEFPDGYPRYRQRVPRLVPGLHLTGERTPPAGRRARQTRKTQETRP